MKLFFLLILVFLISAAIGKASTGNWKLLFSGNLAMCLMLCLTAFGHFKYPAGMAMMVPAFIPFKAGIVLVTGTAEILLGIMLLFPGLRQVAGITLIIFFVLMLPANIYAALNHVNFMNVSKSGPGVSYLWFRVPLQIAFIAWVYFFSVKPLFS